MLRKTTTISEQAKRIVSLFADIPEIGHILVSEGTKHLVIPLENMAIGSVIYHRILHDGWACDMRKNTFNDCCILTAFTDRRY